MAAGDFYRDSTDGSSEVELIITTREDWYQVSGKMYKVHTQPDGSFDNLELIDNFLGSQYDLGIQKKNLMRAGNFDRDIRIGKPKRYSFTEILQPLVILNAPPIHFDVFDGQPYDVCRSYNDHTSDFVAQYIKQTQQSTEVRTEMNRDWSMSASINSGFSFWGVSVSGWGSGVSLDGSYSSEDINTQRTTVESGIDLNVHLAAVDMSIGETRYEVTPYAYWASNGALVVDYAVSPELTGAGGEDTWWDTHYGYFPDRGRAEVELRWQVPEGTPAFPRVYAVIDADNELMEIHENKNVSWNILQKTTGTVIDDVPEEEGRPREFYEAHNYLNPFSGLTRIRFGVPASGHVSITVFNAMGQRIATLADGDMIEGSHIVEFDGKNQAPGIYFCTIWSGAYQQVIKMVLKD